MNLAAYQATCPLAKRPCKSLDNGEFVPFNVNLNRGRVRQVVGVNKSVSPNNLYSFEKTVRFPCFARNSCLSRNLARHQKNRAVVQAQCHVKAGYVPQRVELDMFLKPLERERLGFERTHLSGVSNNL